MLTCTLKKDQFEAHIDWHVGYKFPLTYNEIEIVEELWMDGDEFSHIKENFQNLLYPKSSKSCKYFGDIAKTIAYYLYQKH